MNDKLTESYKATTKAATELLNKVALFLGDADLRTALACAQLHGLKLDKVPDISKEMQALQLSLKATSDAEHDAEAKASDDKVVPFPAQKKE